MGGDVSKEKAKKESTAWAKVAIHVFFYKKPFIIHQILYSLKFKKPSTIQPKI